MIKRIGSREYNTETAELLAVFETDVSTVSPYHYIEVLYQKRSGELFLYGSGNEQTEYANTEIIPLGSAGAREWLIKKVKPIDPELSAAVIARIAKKRNRHGNCTFNMRISAERLDKLYAEAERQGVSAAELINRFIDSL